MTLKEFRKSRNLTQSEFARQVGMRRENIARYEKQQRTPSPAVALHVADIFGLSIEQMWDMFYATGIAHEHAPRNTIVDFVKKGESS